jgi:hypothetical protein
MKVLLKGRKDLPDVTGEIRAMRAYPPTVVLIEQVPQRLAFFRLDGDPVTGGGVYEFDHYDDTPLVHYDEPL